MSSTYAGDPTQFPAMIAIPDDGDPKNPWAISATGLEQLADRTAAISVLLYGTLEIPLLPMPHAGTPTWAVDYHASGKRIRQTVVATGTNTLSLPVPQLANGKITALTVVFRVPAGHVAQPGTLPAVSLVNDANGTAIAGSGGTYVWVDVATYDASSGDHTLVRTISGSALLSTERFTAVITAESGANALDLFSFYRVYATVIPEP